jgi:hypothetical protein
MPRLRTSGWILRYAQNDKLGLKTRKQRSIGFLVGGSRAWILRCAQNDKLRLPKVLNSSPVFHSLGARLDDPCSFVSIRGSP